MGIQTRKAIVTGIIIFLIAFGFGYSAGVSTTIKWASGFLFRFLEGNNYNLNMTEKAFTGEIYRCLAHDRT